MRIKVSATFEIRKNSRTGFFEIISPDGDSDYDGFDTESEATEFLREEFRANLYIYKIRIEEIREGGNIPIRDLPGKRAAKLFEKLEK